MEAAPAQDHDLPEGASCLTCGYTLRRLQERRCPECGCDFDPADPASFRDPRAHPIRYFWTTPPPAWHVGGILAAALVLLVAGSAPHFGTAVILGSRPTLTSLALVVVVAVVLDYLKRAIRRWRAMRPRRWRTARTHSDAWRWAVTPLCGLLLGSAVATDWPLRLRFALSQSAFLDAMAAYYRQPEAAPGETWIGWYRVAELCPHSGGVVLTTHQHGREALGFAYLPGSEPDPATHESFRPLAPAWYVYARR